MHHSPHHLPAPVGRLFSLLPAYPGSRLFAAALNRILVPHLPDDVRAGLARKHLRLRAPDAGIAFDFVWNGRAFAAAKRSEHADLSISASLRDFALLAARREDPDTLFFSRRLVMEGDTELGLMVKNTLDAIEQPLFSLNSLLPRRPEAPRRARPGASHG
ncbi:MAG: SCP2 sterol-binding domain-containing protein [Pseudomonadota bacterium]